MSSFAPASQDVDYERHEKPWRVTHYEAHPPRDNEDSMTAIPGKPPTVPAEAPKTRRCTYCCCECAVGVNCPHCGAPPEQRPTRMVGEKATHQL